MLASPFFLNKISVIYIVIVNSIIIGYALIIILFWLGWETIPQYGNIESLDKMISVLVAVRDEEKNILNLLQSLESQSYPKNKFEVIFIDDHSSDNTMQWIMEFQKSTEMNIIIDQLDSEEGKKAAIFKASSKASGDLLIMTDGDCVVQEDWLLIMASPFSSPAINMLSGPVMFDPKTSFLQSLYSIEFMSVIGSGAATLGWNIPTMCNGANLAVRKSIYDKLMHKIPLELASGDDVFLMHTIHKEYPGSISFCKNSSCIVITCGPGNIVAFLHQRLRWAGKWNAYHSIPTIFLAAMIFLTNFCLVLTGIVVMNQVVPWETLGYLFLIKFVFEYIFLRQIGIFFGEKLNLFKTLLISLIYPVYVVIIGIMSLLMLRYRWKGRALK